MKWVAFILIGVSLVAGVLSAVQAYLPRLDLPDAQLVGLTLNAPAGRAAALDGQPRALFEKGAVLSAAALAELRAAGVHRVRVKEFSLARWTAAGWFAAACAGLLVGAVLLRRAARRRLAGAEDAGGGGASDPDRVLADLRAAVAALDARLPTLAADARPRAILDELTHIQQTHVAALLDTRPRLLARLGLGRYAALMDRFAAAERQLNRAWSAAADGVADEALRCVAAALALLDETRARLTGAP
jgi:hypothetical protein